tara:strand:+ start:2487 stop:3569 length:1083 start_codon:yes stop_codon:yes gene_type:complete
MISYFFNYITLSFLGLIPNKFSLSLKRLFLFFLFMYILIFIALRDQVGGDWYAYLEYFDRFKNENLFKEIFKNDIGFDLLNWVINYLNGNIYVVNLISAIIFLVPLYIFISKRDYFLLSMLISFPYLISVVSMGYVRQAAALGFFIFGLNFLESRRVKFKTLFYIFFISLAFTFHKSAIILFFLVFFFRIRLLFKFLILLTSSLLLIYLLNDNFFGDVYINYIETEMESKGALVRTIMNLIPAVGILAYYKYFKNDSLSTIFLGISIVTILSLLFVTHYSTFIDRISIYFIILQVYFWPKFISLNKKEMRLFIYIFVIILYFITIVIWFVFSSHSEFWIPYKSILTHENNNYIEYIVERY